jgi:transposase-like protein
MKPSTRAAKVRDAIQAGEPVKDIAARFKLKPQTVYTMRWKMTKERVTSPISIKAPKPTPNADFVREELANVERQIDNLNVIASFLTIRLRQLEHNGE